MKKDFLKQMSSATPKVDPAPQLLGPPWIGTPQMMLKVKIIGDYLLDYMHIYIYGIIIIDI
jgi:hypothetical protein